MGKEKKTAAEIMKNLEERGVVFEKTSQPFTKSNSRYAQLTGIEIEPIVLAKQKNLFEKILFKIKKKLKKSY